MLFTLFQSTVLLISTESVQSWSGLHIGAIADSLPINNNERAPSAIPWPVGRVHLIHPMGENSIQILKMAAGCYPFLKSQ